MNGYLMTGDGRISIVYNGKPYSISPTHPNYKSVVEKLDNDDYWDIDKLLDIPKSVVNYLSNEITFSGGNFYYKGNAIHNSITRRIMEFMNNGLPHKPLVAFLSNIVNNPSGRSLNELYGFLEHQGLPITPDGCFMAYKGIRKDNKDIYTGTIDNSPGNVVKFERNKVDDDCTRTCSYGLHVGTLEYASQYAGGNGKVVLVKVNPAHAVSVPIDHNAQKLRVSEYEVIQEVESILPSTYWGNGNIPECDEEDYSDEDDDGEHFWNDYGDADGDNY